MSRKRSKRMLWLIRLRKQLMKINLRSSKNQRRRRKRKLRGRYGNGSKLTLIRRFGSETRMTFMSKTTLNSTKVSVNNPTLP